MSIPFLKFHCTSCDLAMATPLLGLGDVRYQSANGTTFPIDTEEGICFSCETVVAKERIPSIVELEAARRAINSGPLRRRVIRHVFDHLWRLGDLAYRALDPKNDFEIIEEIHASGRRPACLTCGSHEVVGIANCEHVDRDSGDVHQTGIVHPGCSGLLQMSGSNGLRLHMGHRECRYDLKGRLISEYPSRPTNAGEPSFKIDFTNPAAGFDTDI